MIAAWWLGCRADPPAPPAWRPPEQVPIPTCDPPGPAPSASGGGSEIAGNGLDDDGDGWGDEFGAAGRSVVELGATPLLSGASDITLGLHLDVGRGPDGLWVAAAGWTEVSGLQVARGEILRRMQGNPYGNMHVGIGRFAATDAPLLIEDYLTGFYAGSGAQTSYDAVLTLQWPEGGHLGDWGGDSLRVADIDEDGTDEIVAGPASTRSGGHLGVFDGARTGSSWRAVPRFTVEADEDVNSFGVASGAPCDLTGEGVLDVAVFSQDGPGRVWIVPTVWRGTVALTDSYAAVLSGEDDYDDAGARTACGDANGDGYHDLLAGAFVASDRRGVAYLALGPFQQDRAFADSAARLEGEFDHDWCGEAVTFLADSDGDGADDVAIACPGDFYAASGLPGRVHLYRGPESCGALDRQNAARIVVGRHPDDGFGYGVEGGYDIDGDGISDLVATAYDDATYAEHGGVVYLVPRPLP